MYLTVLGTAALLFAGSLSLTAGDLENAYQNLQDAVSKKDPAQIKKLALETCALARQAATAKPPETEAEKEAWPAMVAHARDIELYTEFALYSAAVSAPPEVAVDLYSTLEQQNPDSKYLGYGYGPYLVALTQTSGVAKATAVAEKAIVHFPEDEDLLVVLADYAMNKRQIDRAGTSAERLVTVMNKHPQPEGMTPTDWKKKRTQCLARAYWIAGMVHADKKQYYLANQDLRAALPLVQGNDGMLAPALFFLGIANYQLGREGQNRAQIQEGAKFSEQAAAIPGPYQRQAWTNAHQMRTEAESVVRIR